MPAARCNYIVVYDNSPQVFSASTLETIVKSAPPKNCSDETRSVLFLSYFPDEKELKVFEVSKEELEQEKEKVEAKLREKESKKSD